VDNEIAFFFSLSLSVRADPMGKTDGEGGGNALLLPFDLSETRLPILSVLGVGDALLRGTVLTEIFLPQPAELGSADADRQFHACFCCSNLHSGPSAAGFGQCDLIVRGGGAA
jgi:hypothetical protein